MSDKEMSETKSTMTMVERVARALRGCDPSAGASYEYAARAAIEEMRVPTDEMREAGHWHAGEDCGPCFTAMIDAALNEKES